MVCLSSHAYAGIKESSHIDFGLPGAKIILQAL